MKREAVLGFIITLIVVSVLTLEFNIQQVKASGTIYIRADGSIDPPTANITSADNITYTFTDNNYDNIEIQKDNIVIDGNGYVLQGSGSGYGFYLDSRSGVSIQNVAVKGFVGGIYLRWYSSGNTIKGNTLSNNEDGIKLIYWCNDNTISENNVSYNNYGIFISYGSEGNEISRNTVSDSVYAGIFLQGDLGFNMHACMISENTIVNNGVGISMWRSNGNTIYHNNLNQTSQASSYPSVNTWNNSYPSGGNYWNDYTGADLYSGPYQNETGSDGIGDTPYLIDVDNQDNYPLMNPWSPIMGDVNGDGIVDIFDIGFISAHWYPGPPIGPLGYNAITDINNDLAVDIFDIGIVSAHWGETG